MSREDTCLASPRPVRQRTQPDMQHTSPIGRQVWEQNSSWPSCSAACALANRWGRGICCHDSIVEALPSRQHVAVDLDQRNRERQPLVGHSHDPDRFRTLRIPSPSTSIAQTYGSVSSILYTPGIHTWMYSRNAKHLADH
jgi:hypothetical protein